MPANRSTPSGLEYGPTINQKLYLSLFYHRGNGFSKEKNKWSISPDTEYEIFKNSDEQDLYDTNNDYWGILEQGQAIIGEKGERISKFPHPTNPQDAWHGYPLSPKDERKGTRDSLYPDFDQLIQKWITEEVITKEVGRKIQKKKI
jgi:hypothetical protein